MIAWPAEEKLTDVAKSNLARFKKTAASAELEDDGASTWAFHAFTHTGDPPLRVLLRNENGDEITFTMEADGRWLLRRKDRA